MFRFSVSCLYPWELQSWLDHFEAVGRPAGIVAHDDKLILWRSGSGITGLHGDKEYSEDPVGELVKWVNGFNAEWPKNKVKNREQTT